MKKFIAMIVLAAIGWYGYQHYQQSGLPFLENASVSSSDNSTTSGITKCITKEGEVIYGMVPAGTVCEMVEPVKGSLTIVSSDYFGSTSEPEPDQGLSLTETTRSAISTLSSGYSCTGKQYCSQMRSCEEALFYLNNCPNTKMDSDGDGVPCERQFCGG
ncbi:excalibur calcium-binding domain-containing protein [Endozoicomonas sp.]|uniref:excalibur calcium-binding domain-containing protein n=1 Tax=Endozoicomonas sp. TaxID=1892382 RepID=UPI003AF9EAB9